MYIYNMVTYVSLVFPYRSYYYYYSYYYEDIDPSRYRKIKENGKFINKNYNLLIIC